VASDFIELLGSLADNVGLPAQRLTESRAIVVGGIVFRLMAVDDGAEGELFHYAVLEAPSAGAKFGLYEAALRANNLWSGTGGGTLGLLEETGELVLCGRWPICELNGAKLVVLLMHAASVAQEWLDRIAATSSGRSPSCDDASQVFAARV
jgi:hypothetical protein